MQRIKYVTKQGDKCDVVGCLDGNFIVQAHGNGWGIPFAMVSKIEEV